MDCQPLVSCIIPSYKRTDTLDRAIKSVLYQTYKSIEILVIDDNIPNDSYSLSLQKIVSSYGNEKVRYIGQRQHINGAVARNFGIKNSNGVFIAFLDDDDEWEPEKIELQTSYLLSHPYIGGCSSLYALFKKGVRKRDYHQYTSDDLQFKILSLQVTMYTSTFIGRKEIIEKFGGFNESLIRHQDLQFISDFLNFAPIEPINRVLVKINVDSDINRPNLSKLKIIKENFLLVENGCITKYSLPKQKRIYAAHFFELGYFALKEKKLISFVIYFFRGCKSIASVRDLFHRARNRF